MKTSNSILVSAALGMAMLSCGAWAAGSVSQLVGTPRVLVNEHVDLNVGFTGSAASWSVGPRDADAVPTVQYGPGAAVLHVDASGLWQTPSDGSYAFTGVAPGAGVYRLPQFQDASLLYMGHAAYGVTTSVVDRWNPSTESGGRVVGLGRWVRLDLTSVRGPGHYAAWQEDISATRFMSTAQTGTGPGDLDAIWLVAGGHSHYSVSFSTPGLYEVNLRPRTYLNDGNTTVNGTLSQAAEPIPVYFNVSPGYAVAKAEPAGTGAATAEITMRGGFRAVDLAGAPAAGTVRVNALNGGSITVLLDLADASEAGAVRVALAGFPEGPTYGLPAVAPIATWDGSRLGTYTDYEVGLRFDNLPVGTSDFVFDFTKILDGVGVTRVAVVGTASAIPEPGALAGLGAAAVVLGMRRRR